MPIFEGETQGDGEKKKDWNGLFTDVNDNNLKVIKEAVKNAIKCPCAVTESVHKNYKPN